MISGWHSATESIVESRGPLTITVTLEYAFRVYPKCGNIIDVQC